jgi:hypothetical protein
MPISIYPPTL